MLGYITLDVCVFSYSWSVQCRVTVREEGLVMMQTRFWLTAADPKSYQQLLQAFYPINKARPAYMVVAYFTNFTGTFPEKCDGHTYPWTTFPNFNTTHIQWFLWSTLPANNVVNIQLLTEYGLSVPAQSYYVLFNTAPWWLKVTTTTACVALPYNIAHPQCSGSWCLGALEEITVEVGTMA